MNLPHMIFVKQENNDGDTFLIASENANDMIDNIDDGDVPVGVYVLQTKATARVKVEVR